MQYTTLALAALLGAVIASADQQVSTGAAGHIRRRPGAVGKNNPTSIASAHQLSRSLQDPVVDVEDDHAHEGEGEDEEHVEGGEMEKLPEWITAEGGEEEEHHDDEHGEEHEDEDEDHDLETAVVDGDEEEHHDEHEEGEEEEHHDEHEDEEEHHDEDEEGEHHDEDEDGHEDEHEDEDEHGHEDEGEHGHEDEDEHDHEDEDEHGHEDEDGHAHDDEDEEFSSNTASAMNANSSDGKPWKEVILATLLVNVAALTGVIFLIPTVFRRQICGRKESAASSARHGHGTSKLITLGIPAFAAGALLAASVFLILPEASLLVRSGKVSMLNGAEDANDNHDDHGDEDMHAEEGDHDHAHRYLQGDGHEDHAGHGDFAKGADWKFGCAILGGYLLPMILGAMFPRSHEHVCTDECGEAPGLRRESQAGALALVETGHGCHGHSHSDRAQEDCDAKQTIRSGDTSSDDCEMGKDCVDLASLGVDHEDDSGNAMAKDAGRLRESIFKDEALPATSDVKCRNYRDAINYPLCATILIGDTFHNLADGIFVGIGFLLCSSDVALSILFITLYHEIAQELADFFILTKHAGLSVKWALALNFLSGLSVMLGGIIVLAVKDITAHAVGIILAVAAGVYIYIGASECIPRVEKQLNGSKDRVLGIVMFAVGAIPIGLALLNHQHCDGSH